MQSLGPACRYVRSDFVSHGLAIRDQKGSLHIGYEAKSEQLRQYWQEVCKPKGKHTLNSVSTYVRTRLMDVPKGEHFTVPEITLADIRWSAARTKKSSSPGPGAWRIGELTQLPDQALSEMACIYNAVLRLGITPLWWRQSWTSFLPKSPGSLDVACQRPITVTPMLWRIFARVVNRALTDRVDDRLLQCQHGARRGRNGVDPALRIKAFGDVQRRAGRLQGHLLQLDIAKCFNNLNPADAIMILKHHGLDDGVACMLFQHYTTSKTRNKMAPTWGGVEYQCERGCPQGCPVSVTLANVLLALVPVESDKQVHCSMFLDDTSLYSEHKVKLERIAERVRNNIESLALEIQDPNCSYVQIGDTEQMANQPLMVSGRAFEVTTRTQLLGFDVHSSRIDLPHKSHATRAEASKERLMRVARLPSQRGLKQAVLNAMVTSLWQWAPWEPPVSANFRTAMRRNALDALEGKVRPWETAYEVLAVALLKGHQVDCCWAQTQAALVLYHKALLTNEWLEIKMEDEEPLPGGMLEELDNLVRAMGLSRDKNIITSDRCALTVRLGSDSEVGKIAHDLRQLVRGHLLASLALRRPGMC
eukprot:2479165-Amphidinium_carterae.1